MVDFIKCDFRKGRREKRLGRDKTEIKGWKGRIERDGVMWNR